MKFHAKKWEDAFCHQQRKTMTFKKGIKDTVDLFITDPPFGIGMGDWDKFSEVNNAFNLIVKSF